MKLVWMSLICFVLISCQGNTQDKVELKSQLDTVSYSIGNDIGKNMKAQDIQVNTAALARGISDVLAGGKMLCTDEQILDALTRFRKDLAGKAHDKAMALGEKNKKDGETFLAENKTKEGVKTTASGLQYKVLKMGGGAKPKADQTVTVNYRGTLIDGTEVDDSYKRGQPYTTGLKGIMQGWVEGLQLMPEGSKFVFYIPSDLAYGPAGRGPGIPPNATLVFEVELLSVK